MLPCWRIRETPTEQRRSEMKALILTLAVGIVVSMVVLPALGAAVAGNAGGDTSREDILNVTLSIHIYAPNPEMAGREIMARGAGTLVTQGGQNRIITHDHW